MIKGLKFVFAMTYILILAGCYPGIKGKVVDSVTGTPIQGAIVVAEWTTTGGVPGLTHHQSYKVVETETDKAGKFRLGGVYNPLVNAPAMVIYKSGFIPWRNDMNFKTSVKVYDKPVWQDDMTYLLEPWHEGLSDEKLVMYLGSGFMKATYDYSSKLSKALRNARKQ